MSDMTVIQIADGDFVEIVDSATNTVEWALVHQGSLYQVPIDRSIHPPVEAGYLPYRLGPRIRLIIKRTDSTPNREMFRFEKIDQP